MKLYSQETWRLVTKGRGVALVEENIEGVVKFYVRQSQASNHAVREAACACIAELGAKVSGGKGQRGMDMSTYHQCNVLSKVGRDTIGNHLQFSRRVSYPNAQYSIVARANQKK